MASPLRMRPRRQATRGSLGRGDPFAAEEEEELEAPPRLGRRPGKAPVEPQDEDAADFSPGEEELGDEEEGPSGRRQRGRPSGRRGRADDDEEEEEEEEERAGPSQKRGRRGRPPAAAVKQEPRGNGAAGPSNRAAAAGGAAGGAGRPSAGELRAVNEKVAEYKRVKEHAHMAAEGKAPHTAMEAASRAVVRHMIFAHTEKPGVPVRHAEVAALVTSRFPNLKHKVPVTKYALAHAAAYLAESMGLEMASVPRRNVRGRELAGAEEGTAQYVLRSLVPPTLRSAHILDSRHAPERGLLLVVLSLIQLANGKLEEEDLYRQLAELGVCKDEEHPVFGQPAALLKSFCTRRYIQQEKQQGPDGDVFVYRFAEQAVGEHAEIGERAIKAFIEEQFRAAPGGAD